MKYALTYLARPLLIAVSLIAAACGGEMDEDEAVGLAEPETEGLAKPMLPPPEPLDLQSLVPEEAIQLGGGFRLLDESAEPDEGAQRQSDRPKDVAAFAYSASNTNSATVNTVNASVYLSAGGTITLGTCGVLGASGSGDTFLRLYNPSGVQVALSDDACGLLSRFTYTAPATGYYVLRAGCFANSSCSGTVAYAISGPLFYYSAANTNNATVNTYDYYFTASGWNVLKLGTCGLPGASGSGDTFLRLYSLSTGAQVAVNDDACGGALSQLSLNYPAGQYLLRAGCYSSGACSGTVAYYLE